MKQFQIHNIPDYAKEKQYLLVKTVQGDLWFYGAYNDHEKAVSHMNELNQNYDRHFVIPNLFMCTPTA